MAWGIVAAAHGAILLPLSRSRGDGARGLAGVMALASLALMRGVFRYGIEGWVAGTGVLLGAASACALALAPSSDIPQEEVGAHGATLVVGSVFACIYACVWCVAPH